MTMYGRKLGVVIGIIILGGWFGSVWAADLKIAFVDMQRAANECREGIEAKKALVKEVEKYQRLSAEKQKELQTMKDSLEKQALMLTPDARAAKEKEFQNKGREFQRWVEDSQNEIKSKEMEMLKTIAMGLQKVVQKMGADEGYTLVLEKNEEFVLYASKSIDLTDRVIKAYDAQKK
jgi:outer membrane protein